MTPVESNPLNVRWYYANEQNQAVGPFSFDDLKKIHRNGLITSETNIVEEGGTEWRALARVLPAETVPPPPLPPESKKTARRWPAIIFTILLFPLGLIALWISKGYSFFQKSLLSFTSLAIFIIAITTGNAGVILLVLLSNSLFFIWWSKRTPVWLKGTLTALLCLLFLPPALIPKGEYKSDNTSASVSSVQESSPKPPAEKKLFGLSEDFRVGEFSYRIINYMNQERVGNRYTSVTSSQGAIFVVVDYVTKNESMKTQTVAADIFILKDAKGREYRPSSAAVTALALSGNKDYLLSELQPGISKQTQTAFEVPWEVTQRKMILIVPERGWKPGKAEVLLRE